MATRVQRYGGRAWGTARERRAMVSHPVMMEQLWLAHFLGNEWVAIAHRYDDAKRAMWSGYPPVAAAEADLAAADATVGDLIKQIHAEHAADRSAATRPVSATALKDARALVKAARAQVKAAKALLYPQAKPKLDALGDERASALKGLYRRFCQDGVAPKWCTACRTGLVDADTGICADCDTKHALRKLYWATFNAVTKGHETAAKMVETRRKAGKPAKLRFKRWTGEGTLTVQLARQHGSACRCPDCVTKLLKPWSILVDGPAVRVECRTTTAAKALTVAANALNLPVEVDLDPTALGPVALDPTAIAPWTLTPDGPAHLLGRPATDLADALDQVAILAGGVPVAALNAVEREPGRYRPLLADPDLLAGLPGPAKPRRDPALLVSGKGPWRNVLRLGTWMSPDQWAELSRAEQRRAGRSFVSWQFGDDRLVQLPVQLHRPLPPEADVPQAQLTRTRLGGRHHLSVALTVKLPDPPPADSPTRAALHVGWRRRDDGSLRVGTWVCPTGLSVPQTMTDVLVPHGDQWGEVIMPAAWLAAAELPPALLGRRDKAMAPVLDALADWLADHPDAHTNRVTPEQVRKWRSHGRLAALTVRWRDETPPADSADIIAYLEAWRREDKRLWEHEANLRHKVAGRRNDAWRRVAAWLAGQTGTLVVDDTNIATIRQRGDAAEMDPNLPVEVAQAARARAANAAPGLLRQFAVTTATRDGITVTTVPAAGLTRLHRTCGQQGAPDPRYAIATVVTCPHCGQHYDQDHNAATLMLERAATEATPT